MSRNFGIMNGPASLRGVSADRPAALDSYAPSDSILVPARPPLESRDISDALRDVIAVGWAILFITTVGLVFAGSLFILFFVKT